MVNYAIISMFCQYYNWFLFSRVMRLLNTLALQHTSPKHVELYVPSTPQRPPQRPPLARFVLTMNTICLYLKLRCRPTAGQIAGAARIRCDRLVGLNENHWSDSMRTLGQIDENTHTENPLKYHKKRSQEIISNAKL